MKGDFSRNTFNPHNHYIGVRWKQGAPTTDADLNEAQDIVIGRIEIADADTIGISGAPKIAPGFALNTDSAGQLQIGGGHFYVDGILVENGATVSYSSQPYWPDVPSLEVALDKADVGLVFLEVFRRHVTFHDRPVIRDVALNGLDTTSRLETVWRVHVLSLGSVKLEDPLKQTTLEQTRKIREIDQELTNTVDPQKRAETLRLRKKTLQELEKVLEDAGISCAASYPEYEQFTKPLTGTLVVTAEPGVAEDNPCNVPETGGYTRGENQYYIVQVHSVPADGSRNGATFKFSRDNGSIVSLIKAVGGVISGTATGTVFDVDSVQRDDYLGLHVNDWVEYVDDGHELSGAPGILAQVTEADVNLRQVTLDRPIEVSLGLHPKLRKWDQVAPLASSEGVPMNTTSSPVFIEGGMRLLFDGSFRPGDYWQWAARAADASLDFPAGPQAPSGVKRHYAPLGFILMVEGQDGGRKAELLLDCRELFPPLTGITAEDITFDNSECRLPGVATVQDAIEAFCHRTGEGGSCTFVVSPSPTWLDVFSRIPDGGDAQICFKAGEYTLDGPVQIARKGALKLVGAGSGTRIKSTKGETTLGFHECASVSVEDLYAESSEAGSGGAVLEGLQGVLSFTDCTAVTMRRVTMRCSASITRAAACARVINKKEFADIRLAQGVIDIQDCFFQVGSSQLGALVINGGRVFFNNNVFRCHEMPAGSTVLYQGITVGGEEAEEVRILNNTVIDALQGIHIGQSRRSQPKDERLRSTNVIIEGNTIYSRITPAVNHEAFGIYVGNCDSLSLRNNNLRREPVPSTEQFVIDEIHVSGELGWKAIVRDNETQNYTRGIFIDSESSIKEPLWVVSDNVATVTARDTRVLQSNNKSKPV